MKRTTLRVAAALIAAGVAGPASAAPPYGSAPGSSQATQAGPTAAPTQQDAQNVVQDWPQVSQNAANEMLQRYGAPTSVADDHLVWKDKAPFTKITVMRDGIQNMFPTGHQDVVSEEVNMQVPIDKVSDLARFDGSLIIDRTKGTVAARSDSEANNYLALNLANDIIDGKRDVESARQFFADTAAKSLAGKSSDYTSKLLFTPKADTADPGQSVSASRATQPGGEQNPNALPSPNQQPGSTPRQGY